MTDDVRPEIVHALFEATQDAELSDEVTREMLMDASPAEQQAVSDLHGALADLSMSRAVGLWQALEKLRSWWYDPRVPLGTILKLIPPDVADDVIETLYSHGFTEADGIPSRPRAPDAGQ